MFWAAFLIQDTVDDEANLSPTGFIKGMHARAVMTHNSMALKRYNVQLVYVKSSLVYPSATGQRKIRAMLMEQIL